MGVCIFIYLFLCGCVFVCLFVCVCACVSLTPYLTGIDVGNTLKQLAERRTDIFGKGGEETMIGKKIGEEELPQAASVQWDGHSSSMDSVIAQAKKNVTIDEQIEAIQRSKGLLLV